MIVKPVDWNTYAVALHHARSVSDRVREATSSPDELPSSYRFFLTEDAQSGYGVAGDGTLVGVFSLVKGRGESLVWDAVLFKGAHKLDCFDGFLPTYYKRFGFAETHRVANWTPGEPDVVFMALDV
ncbi:acetyltransferase [Streptomyces phage Lannister]|uniref:Acetyltransferase n=1 Tax=Streptomyces phage Lannister TaxID=1674927 RepID=A0A0K1Y9G7_9CAUD|nr:acetyltransferase [Streptomyces phage Lannister]AKY03755.1 acetyltransferase [Streptomyces phage Lannister]